MKTLLVTLLLAASLINFGQDNTYVYFDSDKYKLDDSDRETIFQFVSTLQSKDQAYIYLVGHTDSDGTNKYNQDLSYLRANSVSNYLQSLGICPSKIKMKWKGENNPVATNGDESGKQLNRRVELVSGNVYTEFQEEEGIHSLFNESKIDDQVFMSYSGTEIKIEGKKGTIITIPANALINAQGEQYSGMVSIKLKEVYSYEDMVMCDIQTASGDQLIETGGMIKLTVNGKGEELFLRPGVNAEVQMPTTDPKSDMQVFYGKRDDGELDWQTNDGLMDMVSLSTTNPPKNTPNYASGSDEMFVGWRINMNAIGKKVKTQEEEEVAQKPKTYYNLKIDKFKWINCDRFPNLTAWTDQIVAVNAEEVAQVVIVFEDLKAMMSANFNPRDRLYQFKNLPKGKEATILVVCLQDGEPFIQTRKIKTGEQGMIKMGVEQSSHSQMHSALAVLDL